VNSSDPLFAICEACNATFTSFAFRSEEAEREVKHQFDAHECKRVMARTSPGTSTAAGPDHSTLVCRVCNKPIRLEEGGISTDENGKALHTKCYVNEIIENRKKNESANSKE
jgi:hypothetical protein